jgi:hypothetical protein
MAPELFQNEAFQELRFGTVVKKRVVQTTPKDDDHIRPHSPRVWKRKVHRGPCHRRERRDSVMYPPSAGQFHLYGKATTTRLPPSLSLSFRSDGCFPGCPPYAGLCPGPDHPLGAQKMNPFVDNWSTLVPSSEQTQGVRVDRGYGAIPHALGNSVRPGQVLTRSAHHVGATALSGAPLAISELDLWLELETEPARLATETVRWRT